jgi:formaldehyde-activating enzyme involved in methanogenesis
VVAAAVVVAGEVAVAVAEAVADVVVGGRSPFDNKRDLTPISGWTGGNSDPIRNSRW